VGTETADDAAVVRIDGGRVLVQTVDFFTPILDDPYLFGAVAAANSVSDVYAMGAEPLVGLAIAGFPTDKLPLDVLEQIFAGGAAKAAEAGFVIAGGHTIIDDVPKYGLVVTGTCAESDVILNSTAKPGDLLYLTKPLGNGIVVCAYRAATISTWKGKAPAVDVEMEEAVRWMQTLNRDASRAMVKAGASACTDVTGYGLLGHLREMCAGSGTGARIEASKVPLLRSARSLAEKGFIPAGSKRNESTLRAIVRLSASELDYSLLCDAQTSGGLLIAVPPDGAAVLERELAAASVPVHCIGAMTDEPGVIEVTS
jgi:selenide,water dikinase